MFGGFSVLSWLLWAMSIYLFAVATNNSYFTHKYPFQCLVSLYCIAFSFRVDYLMPKMWHNKKFILWIILSWIFSIPQREGEREREKQKSIHAGRPFKNFPLAFVLIYCSLFAPFCRFSWHHSKIYIIFKPGPVSFIFVAERAREWPMAIFVYSVLVTPILFSWN